MAGIIRPAVLALLIGFLCFSNNGILFCNGEAKIPCNEAEKVALLQFKHGLKDRQGFLSSWVEGGDCCAWRGVGCNTTTGHVVKIDLSYDHLYDGFDSSWRLGGEINSSLLDLKHLSYLDLSFNDFEGIGIPDFIGLLSGLSYLNLSNAGFGGILPRQLGNLSSLQYLDLNSVYSSYDLNAESFQWISKLSSLKYLDMSSVSLRMVPDWFDAVNMLASLSVLRLPNCQLQGIPTVLPYSNLTSLATIDLGGNQIKSVFPRWLFNISSLVHVHLRLNQFYGSIPDAFDAISSLEVLQLEANDLSGLIPRTVGGLCNLRTLDLSRNNLSGDTSLLSNLSSGCASERLEILSLRENNITGNLAEWIGKFQRLTILDLAHNLLYGPIPASLGNLSALGNLFLNFNNFNGILPETVGKLSKLSVIDLSYNALEGVISEVHLVNLSSLDDLSLAANNLEVRLSSDWIPSFRLTILGLYGCRIGPNFPPWLKTQKDYSVLDLSNTGIVDTMPDWFWNLSHQTLILDLSNNAITGEVPASLRFGSISILDLSSNKFSGLLPSMPSNIEYLDLSNNSFSESLLSMFSKPMPILSSLSLSKNRISGAIPETICQMLELYVIDLSSNYLIGKLPRCLEDLPFVNAIDFSNNSLTGEIVTSSCSPTSLQTLHLGGNNFQGDIPFALKSCKNLVTLDLGNNRLSGAIPTWIAEGMPRLRILRLRSNGFNGDIPPQLSNLPALQILDLADNKLSGVIPQSFGNFRAMILQHKVGEGLLDVLQGSVQSSIGNYGPMGFIESLQVVIKGREMQYSKTLQYVTSIDLSGNDLSGSIPSQLANLLGLHNLNLSGNGLTGMIPYNIGALKLLESLDLSRNNLEGPIPSSLSLMTSLSHLNLSYNNLTGRIPSGYQLQTINEPSMYVGNPGLCGPPLDFICTANISNNGLPIACDAGDDECKDEKLWFYISIVLGFVVGFWALCGTLMANFSWRTRFFQFVDWLENILCMAIAAKIAGFQRREQD